MSRIVAVTAQRGEPDWLVDDLRKNLHWCDEVIVVDNRRQSGGWAHEGALRAHQRELARAAGAEWVLFVDPDERLEDSAARIVPDAVRTGPLNAVYGFPLREMWTPTQYRVDGIWAAKKPRRRLIRLGDRHEYPNKPIHCGLAAVNVPLARITLHKVRLYHLKNIEPGNRTARAEAYLAADPAFRHQRRAERSWAFLYDETGLCLESVPDGRGFSPPYDRPYIFTPPR